MKFTLYHIICAISFLGVGMSGHGMENPQPELNNVAALNQWNILGNVVRVPFSYLKDVGTKYFRAGKNQVASESQSSKKYQDIVVPQHKDEQPEHANGLQQSGQPVQGQQDNQLIIVPAPIDQENTVVHNTPRSSEETPNLAEKNEPKQAQQPEKLPPHQPNQQDNQRSDKKPVHNNNKFSWVPAAIMSPTAIIGGIMVTWLIYLKFNKSMYQKTEEALVQFQLKIMQACRSLKKSVQPLRIVEEFNSYQSYMKKLEEPMKHELKNRVIIFAKAVEKARNKSLDEIADIITPSFKELVQYIENTCLAYIREQASKQKIGKHMLWLRMKQWYHRCSQKVAHYFSN